MDLQSDYTLDDIFVASGLLEWGITELRGVDAGHQLGSVLQGHYGSRSRRGTHVAALFYSLIESAKLSGVEPKRYLLTATRAGLVDRPAITLPRDLLESC